MKINFFFARRARAQKSPVRLRIRPGISQNNTLPGNTAVSLPFFAVAEAAKSLKISKIHILVYKFSQVICVFFPFFFSILSNKPL